MCYIKRASPRTDPEVDFPSAYHQVLVTRNLTTLPLSSNHSAHDNPNLTYLPLVKMTAISQTIFQMLFLNEKFDIRIKISRKFVPSVPIDNNPALV